MLPAGQPRPRAQSMKPQSAKAKGRRLQQLIVADVLEAFPQLEADDVRSTSMGAGGEDIQLSAAARRCFPYSIEAKNQERLNVWGAIAQARSNCPSGSQPLVVIRKNGERAQAVLDWQLFLALVRPEPPLGAAPEPPPLAGVAECLQSARAALDALEEQCGCGGPAAGPQDPSESRHA